MGASRREWLMLAATPMPNLQRLLLYSVEVSSALVHQIVSLSLCYLDYQLLPSCLFQRETQPPY